jgi:NADPH-dependent 2,4-dienoyl-CoA reductase/sulfur reductase-like enzyme/nitrite reductase/ring-hydroxylating ferredoxin subunit
VSDHPADLSGPDLSLGVEMSVISSGEMLTGHAFGEPVLLARVGPNWFAVGAKCTHYSAPLGDGILTGESIRCPWHHACFNLRNGAATWGPALNDLPVYDVVDENNRVRVVKKDSSLVAREPRRPRQSRIPDAIEQESPPLFGPRSVLILGAGAAGIGCAEMLRREGYRGPITIVDSDPDAPYDRPNLSKDYLAGNAPEDWLPLHPREFYDRQCFEILRGVEATSIDTNNHIVQLNDGSSRTYGALLIATGASPVRLQIPGGESIRYLRTLADCRAIIAGASQARSAVVIGSSFIGLEVAASLRTRGLEVHVVAPEKVPLERVLGAEIGELIRRVHEEKGVVFHLGRKPSSIAETVVTLDNGEELPADLVVAGVGVRPNLRVAETANLVIDNGVAVDQFLETSVRGVFAAGDIASWPDPYANARIRVEHWVVAMRQGQVVARNMLGNRDRFDDIPFFWSNHYDNLSIQYSGHAQRWDATRVEGDIGKMDCAVSYMIGGERRAMATINRDRQNLENEITMEKALILRAPSNPTLMRESN